MEKISVQPSSGNSLFYLKDGNHRSRKSIEVTSHCFHGTIGARKKQLSTKQIHSKNSKGEHKQEQQGGEGDDTGHRMNHYNKLVSDWSD